MKPEVEKTFDVLSQAIDVLTLKYNPNRDELGRFSSGGGVGEALAPDTGGGTGGGESEHDRAIREANEDSEARQTLPGSASYKKLDDRGKTRVLQGLLKPLIPSKPMYMRVSSREYKKMSPKQKEANKAIGGHEAIAQAVVARAGKSVDSSARRDLRTAIWNMSQARELYKKIRK